jgi:serine protease Do
VALALLLAIELFAGPGVAGERWGWLGVRIRDLSEQEMEELTVKLGLREGFGVVVAEVLPDSPALAAALRSGDIVVSIAGRPVVETRSLQRIVGGAPAGRELVLVVLREGRRQEIRVRVGEMPADVVAERVAAEFGFFVRSATPEEGAPSAPRALVVAAVGEGTAAARGGLAVGDRVLAVNGVEVASLEGFRQEVQGVFLRDVLRLTVERRGERAVVTLPPVQPLLPPH